MYSQLVNSNLFGSYVTMIYSFIFAGKIVSGGVKMKSRVVFMDTEKRYILPLVFKLLEKYGDIIEFDVFCDIGKMNLFLASERKTNVLVIDGSVLKDINHNIKGKVSKLIILTDAKNITDAGTAEQIVLYKYSAMNVLYHVISSHCERLFQEKEQTIHNTVHVVMVTSMQGGAGKSLIAYSLAKMLRNIGQKALYVDIEWNQDSGDYLLNPVLLDSICSQKLLKKGSSADEILEMVETDEGVDYLPNMDIPLIVMNKKPEQFLDVVNEVKDSKQYNYIILDTDSSCDVCKMKLIELCTEYVFVMDQSFDQRKLEQFFENFNIRRESCYFVCNRVTGEMENTVRTSSGLEFRFSAKIPYMDCIGKEKVQRVASQTDFQALGYLLD